MNLKEAINLGRLNDFITEHEIPDLHPDGENRFFKLMELMFTESPLEDAETSDLAAPSDCAETQTRRDT